MIVMRLLGILRELMTKFLMRLCVVRFPSEKNKADKLTWVMETEQLLKSSTRKKKAKEKNVEMLNKRQTANYNTMSTIKKDNDTNGITVPESTTRQSLRSMSSDDEMIDITGTGTTTEDGLNDKGQSE
ncbi:hypothetical protein GQR58_007149 [Nymphon striatum]|nr:hypothetical protein GQR58_007149 [Nymphon striatum]